jgi:predicted alpha/beta-hydrolase family hydrolase
MTERVETRFVASKSSGEVSAILDRPEGARWVMVLGHGAGTGMRHRFLEEAASALAGHGIASFRYQFPYVEKRSSRPDPQPVLLATVRSAVGAARSAALDLPLLAGGKSMGGRMTSLASAAEALPGVRGVVFFGFPLHPAGTPGISRAEHLARVEAPMLFLQGTRDKLADLDLLRPVVERLRSLATLHVVEGADHSFAVLKRSGRTGADVLEELARTVAEWAEQLP